MKSQQPKKTMVQIKTRPHSHFSDKFLKKLHDNVCVIEPLTTLCGGWYIQTFKQVTNKLCKNKSSPLPLFFATVDMMEPISKNKTLLKKIFQSFDTRQLNRIDACQVFCAFLLLSKGSYQTFLKTIIDIFGFQNSGRITKHQFFFFLDSFYRMLPKIFIVKGFDKPLPETNLRLQYTDINKFVDLLFQSNRTQIQRNQIYELLMKVPELNEFLKYLQKKGTTAAQTSRTQTISKMKFQADIRNCVSDMVLKVHLQLQKKVKQSARMILN